MLHLQVFVSPDLQSGLLSFGFSILYFQKVNAEVKNDFLLKLKD